MITLLFLTHLGFGLQLSFLKNETMHYSGTCISRQDLKRKTSTEIKTMVLLMGRKENWKGRDRRSFKIL